MSLKFRDCTFQVHETVSVIWNNQKEGKVTLLLLASELFTWLTQTCFLISLFTVMVVT